MNSLPELVVAGAMKAGTTSVMEYLSTQSGFNTGRIKEPNIFALGSTAASASRRSRLNYGSVQGVRVDGTTEYTKPPDSDSHAEVVKTLVPDARILYLVRDPVRRARSHYTHNIARGVEKRNIMTLAMTSDSDYVLTSKYRTCIEPWVRRFGESVVVLNTDLLFDGDPDEREKFRKSVGLGGSAPLEFKRLNAKGSVSNVRTARAVSRSIPGYSLLRPLLPTGLRAAAVKSVGAIERRYQADPSIVDDILLDTFLSDQLAGEIEWIRRGCPTEELGR